MAIQLGVATRNARLDAIETAVGTAPKLQIRSGAAPADCATADSGTLLCEITLPSDWMSAAASGQKAKLGTWQANGVANGTAGHFRLKDSAGSVCHIQGTVATSAADLIVDNTSINSGQQVTVTGFTLTDANA